MKPETVLNTLRRTGPLRIDELYATIHRRHKDVSEQDLLAALEEMRERGLAKCSPLGRWLASVQPEPGSASEGGSTGGPAAETGHRVRALLYSPQVIADVPEFTRNTFLHFVGTEKGGFRLRDYTRGKRIEVDHVGAITRTDELQEHYDSSGCTWTVREFSDDEAHTPLTDNAFWSKRLQAANRANRQLLKDHESEALGV